ncbi:MAG TPA: hypothetical protein VG388_00885 [Solirubrobacteraceae bacterium]|jgi:hypothetical protein|nr:hypothetical protein [Solirubrobacteraceae bacterium]
MHTIHMRLARRPAVSRRDLQIILGMLWLLDGALQAQPFMFTHAFATQVIAPVGQGQPGVVSGPVHLASLVVDAHPVAWDVVFALGQLLLGVGLLVRRTARITLAASIAWAIAVWYAGEGLSSLASGHASLLTGAPGSALLYAVLAVAAWPHVDARATPARWLVPVWALLWIVVGTAFQLMPGQNTGSELANLLKANAGTAPHWLASVDTSVATWVGGHGVLGVGALAAVEFLIGVGALWRRTRGWAVGIGLVLSLAIWVLGQDIGLLYSGQATDPNSGPLIALMALVLLAQFKAPTTVRPAGSESSVAPQPAVRDHRSLGARR